MFDTNGSESPINQPLPTGVMDARAEVNTTEIQLPQHALRYADINAVPDPPPEGDPTTVVGGEGRVFRYRLAPTLAQETALLGHCDHARFVWNLGLEQRLMWRPGRPPAPGYVAQVAQLTEARAAEPWLAAGSQAVQQQALRDLDQAWRNYWGGTHSRPTWRKAGRHEEFRIVGPQAQRVERLNRKWGRVLVPKAGWIRFRWSRQVPDAKSYRITRDRIGRWHIAFTAIPDPTPAPGNG